MRNDVSIAKDIYQRCVELSKKQGGAIYDVDFYRLFSPFGVEVKGEWRRLPLAKGARIVVAKYEVGKTIDVIVEETGYSRKSVLYYVREYAGVRKDKRCIKIKNDLKEGKKQADIARAYGVSRQYVSYLNRRMKNEIQND